MKKIKVTITLTDESWRRLRMRALAQSTSASAIIDTLIGQKNLTAIIQAAHALGRKSPKKGRRR